MSSTANSAASVSQPPASSSSSVSASFGASSKKKASSSSNTKKSKSASNAGTNELPFELQFFAYLSGTVENIRFETPYIPQVAFEKN